MNQIIAISQLSMRRLLNYQRVTENNANSANRRQWVDMTLETMQHAEKTGRKASHISATVDYAGYLFRVQNNMTAYRPFYADGHLHNALVALMNELAIPVGMVSVEDCTRVDPKRNNPVGPAVTPRTPLVLVASNANGERRCCQ